MFQELLSRLTAPTPTALPEPDARLALAALLVRIAKADGAYEPSEIAQLELELTKRYGLSSDEAKELRADAETLEAEAPDTVRFTRAIKDAVPYEARAEVVEALWSMVLADGVRDAEENALLRMVAPMLGVNDRDSALARQRAEAGL